MCVCLQYIPFFQSIINRLKSKEADYSSLIINKVEFKKNTP